MTTTDEFRLRGSADFITSILARHAEPAASGLAGVPGLADLLQGAVAGPGYPFPFLPPAPKGNLSLRFDVTRDGEDPGFSGELTITRPDGTVTLQISLEGALPADILLYEMPDPSGIDVEFPAPLTDDLDPLTDPAPQD